MRPKTNRAARRRSFNPFSLRPAPFLLGLAAVWFALAGRLVAASENFAVRGVQPDVAAQIEDAAETFRRELAVEWLGRDLPPWGERCPIAVTMGPRVGNGGATSFVFERGRVFGWQMTIQGTPEEIVGSVLRHEVLHTVFASHFRQPLPRWADEGACGTVEQPSQRVKLQAWLVNFLKTGRGIPFDQMFAMRDYPRDILPLYAQGHSLAGFLLEHDSKPHFVNFVAAGLRASDWTGPVQAFYGYASLGSLQDAWLEWVKSGSPAAESRAIAAYGGVLPRCRFKWNGRGFVKVCEQPATQQAATQPTTAQQSSTQQPAALEPVSSPPQPPQQDAFDHATLATKDDLAGVIGRVKALEEGEGGVLPQLILKHSNRIGLIEKAQQDADVALETLTHNHGQLAKGVELLGKHDSDLSLSVGGIEGQIKTAIEEAGPVLAKSAAKQALAALGEKGFALEAGGGSAAAGGAVSLGAGALGALGGWPALALGGPLGLGLGVAGWLLARAVKKRPAAAATTPADLLSALLKAGAAATVSAPHVPPTQTVVVDRSQPAVTVNPLTVAPQGEENVYAPFPVQDKKVTASAEARRLLVKNFPGSAGFIKELERLESMIAAGK